MNYKDALNPESCWRHMSCTVSVNIIFVHAQKFAVTVRSPKLLFPHTASHSLRRRKALYLMPLTRNLISGWKETK